MATLPLIAAGLVLLPGVHAWWTGRRLLARTADPAFPELLLERAQQRGIVAVSAGALVVPMAMGQWVWTVPLLVLGLLIGGFPFRKALYSERWSLGAYLRFTLLSIIGGAGFWLLLGFAPRLVVAIVGAWEPARPVLTATVLGLAFAILLIAWELRFPQAWMALHSASPLERPDLQPRLDDIVRRSGLTPAPYICRFGAPGSYMMNAIALVSIRRPGVGFGDTLLELLEPDEITAVFAHEIAHLEHYNPRRMRRLRLLTWLLVAGGVAVAAASIHYLPAYATLIAMVWPLIVLGMLMQRLSVSQKHEAESDRRSAELMGDPEPMVRALTKLHHYSKLPRRWPYDFERSASHPSLARRIQALRALATPAGTTATNAPVEGMEPTVLRSTKPGSYIVLDATRIYWLDGVTLDPAPIPARAAEDVTTPASDGAAQPAQASTTPSLGQLRERATSYRATAYAELVELRVGVAGLGRAIQVRSRDGKSSSTPLHPDDVAAAQRALDALDGQLATRGGHDWRVTTRLVATIIALLMFGSLNFGLAWIPIIIALIAPSAWSLVAAGTLSAGLAAVTVLSGRGQAGVWSWVLASMLVIIGGIACIVAWRWARSVDVERRKRITQVAFAMASTLLLVGMKGYRGREATIAWTTAPADVVGRLEMEEFGRGITLSPGGSRVAIQTVHATNPDPYDDDVASWRFTLSELRDGALVTDRHVDALAMEFVDDERILALRASGSDSLELVLASAGADSTVQWRRTMPSLMAPTLGIDRASRRWTVVGHVMGTSEMLVVRGALDTTPVVVERHSYDLLGGRPLYAWPDGSVLSATVDVGPGMPRAMLAGFGLIPFEWTIMRTGQGKRQPIGDVPGVPDCTADVGGPIHCVVTGTKGATLWRIGDDSVLTLIGALPRDADLWRIGGTNQLFAVRREGGTIAILDAATGRGTWLSLPDSTDREHIFLMDAAIASGKVAALANDDGRSTVTVYRIR